MPQSEQPPAGTPPAPWQNHVRYERYADRYVPEVRANWPRLPSQGYTADVASPPTVAGPTAQSPLPDQSLAESKSTEKPLREEHSSKKDTTKAQADHRPRFDKGPVQTNFREWTYDRDHRTNEEWQRSENDKNANFIAFCKTPGGGYIVNDVLRRFRSLKKPSQVAHHVSWFLREVSTPGTRLNRLVATMRRNGAERPDVSGFQLVLLKVLTSRHRHMKYSEIIDDIGDVSSYWANPCRRGALESMVKEVLRNDLFAQNGPHLGFDAVVRLTEEDYFWTDRWQKGLPDRINSTSTPSTLLVVSEGTVYPRQIKALPTEILLDIAALGAKVEGTLIFSSTDTTSWGERNVVPEETLIMPGQYLVASNGMCPWVDVYEDFGPYDWLAKLLTLRSVSRQWDDIVTETFFNNSIIFDNVTSYAGGEFRYDGISVGDWFVPDRGVKSVGFMDTNICIRYAISRNGDEREPNDDVAGYYTTNMTRARDFICLDQGSYSVAGASLAVGGPSSQQSVKVIQVSQGFQVDRECGFHVPKNDRYINRDEFHGLVIRGFWYHVSFDNVPHVPKKWRDIIHLFIWTMMNNPSSVPREGNAIVLNLGYY